MAATRDALDAQDKVLFTPQRRDATTGELLPEGSNIVDLAARHGWTYDQPEYDSAGHVLTLRLQSPKGTLDVIDLQFSAASLRTINSPFIARTGFHTSNGYAYQEIPKDIRQRVERFIVAPDCCCPNGSYLDVEADPECETHGE